MRVFLLILYAVTVVAAYAVLRIIDGDEEIPLSVGLLWWLVAAAWPLFVPFVLIVELLAFLNRMLDRLIFHVWHRLFEGMISSAADRIVDAQVKRAKEDK